jgi:hypothetical protein
MPTDEERPESHRLSDEEWAVIQEMRARQAPGARPFEAEVLALLHEHSKLLREIRDRWRSPAAGRDGDDGA